MNTDHIADINIAQIKRVIMDDPIMNEFADNLDTRNALAESSDGFVWRLKDESNNQNSYNPCNDAQVIVNLSVLESFKQLE